MKSTSGSLFSNPLVKHAAAVVLGLSSLYACKGGKQAEPESPAPADTAEAKPAQEEKTAPGALPAPEDVAGPSADAEVTVSGLASKVLTKGSGDKHPTATDRVQVHYTGWSKDGKMFDSSVVRGEPATFGLNQVIPGWTEGVQLMVEGEKRRFWIPGNLAYGDTPRRAGAPSGQLTFDVELIKIVAPPEVPADVAAPPAGAKKTASGLAYKVLKEGDGPMPSADARVTVHYSGWTTEGKMFDSSVVRERPAVFAVKGVIPGWTEGLQLMKVGSKFRFWIPAKLAYGEKPLRPGTPAGQLTFDVELLGAQEMPKPAVAQPAPQKPAAAPPKPAAAPASSN